MKKIVEKIAIVLSIFGFKPIEEHEESRTFIWRMKKVESSKIARNYVLAIARAFGPDYSFSVRYAGPRGVMEKYGKHPYFTQKMDSGSWPTRWTLDVYHDDDCVNCVGSFVFFIQ